MLVFGLVGGKTIASLAPDGLSLGEHTSHTATPPIKYSSCTTGLTLFMLLPDGEDKITMACAGLTTTLSVPQQTLQV